MAYTYDQLRNATEEQLRADSGLLTAWSGGNTNASTLLNDVVRNYGTGGISSYWQSNLSPDSHVNSELSRQVDRYLNWNNPLQPTDQARAMEQRDLALKQLNEMKSQYESMGIDFMSIPTYRDYYNRLNFNPTGGTAANQGALNQVGAGFMDTVDQQKAAVQNPAQPPAQPAPGQVQTQATGTQPAIPGQQPAGSVQMPTFYKPDPNSQQVYNAKGEAVSYQQFIAQGGAPDFSNVKNEAVPIQQPQQGTQQGQVAGATTQGPQATPSQVSQATTPNAAADPIAYVADLYKKVNESLGISTLKQQMEKYNKDLLDLRNEKTDKAQGINDNPWYTEGKRVGELRKLDEKYEQRETNLLGYLQLSQSLYNTALSQAQNMAGDVMQIDQQNRAYAQEQADARMKLSQGMPFYKYPGSDVVFNTATGQAINYEQYKALGGAGVPGAEFGDVFEINPEGDQEKALVMDLASKYVDAKILPSDSLAVAQSKLAGSRIYQDQVRPPQGPSSSVNASVIDVNGQKVLINNDTGEIIKNISSAVGGDTGIPTDKLTAEQSKARQFAVSAEDANKRLASLSYSPGAVEPWLPNAFKSSERQQFEQAARAFVNATLRRESGATITDSEFTNKYKELIPVAGDGKEVIANKASARTAAVDSIKQAGLLTTPSVAGANTNIDPLGIR